MIQLTESSNFITLIPSIHQSFELAYQLFQISHLKMFDPVANDMIPAPSSPTISSVSSSDLDTVSTGSFFHDRSTSLGTLMGVNFPTITFRTPSQSQARVASSSSAAAGGGGRKKQRKKRLALAAEKRRRWWSICRDNDDAKPGSLGQFLEVERRFGDGDFYGTEVGELEGVMSSENGRRGALFANGRVLPPVTQVEESPSTAAVLCRFPISGICS